MKLFNDEYIYKIEMSANRSDKDALDALIEQTKSEGITNEEEFFDRVWNQIPEETKESFGKYNGKQEAFVEYIKKSFLANQKQPEQSNEKVDEEISSDEGVETDQGEVKGNTVVFDSYFKIKMGDRELLGSIRAKDSSEAINVVLKKYNIEDEDKIVARKLTDMELSSQNEVNGFISQLQDYIANYNHNHDAKIHISRESIAPNGSDQILALENHKLPEEIEHIRESMNKKDFLSTIIYLHHDTLEGTSKIIYRALPSKKGVKESVESSIDVIKDLYGDDKKPLDTEENK